MTNGTRTAGLFQVFSGGCATIYLQEIIEKVLYILSLLLTHSSLSLSLSLLRTHTHTHTHHYYGEYNRHKETNWIFKEVDESPIEFSYTAEDDSTLDHKVSGCDEDCKYSSREMLIREVSHPQRGGDEGAVEL